MDMCTFSTGNRNGDLWTYICCGRNTHGLSRRTALAHRLRAHNPVIWADVPDPSVVRVGDLYYMSSTTMHMLRGCRS